MGDGVKSCNSYKCVFQKVGSCKAKTITIVLVDINSHLKLLQRSNQSWPSVYPLGKGRTNPLDKTIAQDKI